MQQESYKPGSHRIRDYIKTFVWKIEIINSLLLIMNMHIHRMMSHSIWLSCLVMVIEFLGAGNSKFVAYGYVHIAIEL